MGRPSEIQHTAFLAERLSEVTGKDFIAESEEEQNSDTDTWVITESGERVAVQNVTSEGELMKHAKLSTMAIAKGLSITAEEVRHPDWITDALAGKVKKLYSNAEKLIIVVHASLPYMPAQYIRDAVGSLESPFAGIYYVCVSTTEPENSYVVALKKFWNTPCIF